MPWSVFTWYWQANLCKNEGIAEGLDLSLPHLVCTISLNIFSLYQNQKNETKLQITLQKLYLCLKPTRLILIYASQDNLRASI